MDIVSSLNCVQHNNENECPDVLIRYIDKFNEYGIAIHNGGSSVVLINYCPFCGSELPESKRDLWFEQLDKLGFNDPAEQDIPEEFKSNAWIKNL